MILDAVLRQKVFPVCVLTTSHSQQHRSFHHSEPHRYQFLATFLKHNLMSDHQYFSPHLLVHTLENNSQFLSLRSGTIVFSNSIYCSFRLHLIITSSANFSGSLLTPVHPLSDCIIYFSPTTSTQRYVPATAAFGRLFPCGCFSTMLPFDLLRVLQTIDGSKV